MKLLFELELKISTFLLLMNVLENKINNLKWIENKVGLQNKWIYQCIFQNFQTTYLFLWENIKKELKISVYVCSSLITMKINQKQRADTSFVALFNN
jgi:hypothetical protein